ncbi:MAG: hypothetical protein UHL07_07585 [Bacteroidaceae bacterium]|nr:hypothetical protein [Bacteroidaceae bacterium]
MNTELFVSHSYVRCLRHGLAYALKNLGSILLFSWPSLLILLVGGVLMDSHVFMAYARGEGVGVIGYCSLTLFVLAVLLLQAAIVWQQHGLGANGALPKGNMLHEVRQMLKLFGRNVCVSMVSLLVIGGVGAALWLGADRLSLLAKSTDISILGWIGIGLGGVVLFIFLLALLAFLQLLWANFLYGNQRFFDTVRVTLRGMRHLTRTMGLQFVQLIYSLGVLLVFCLPYALFVEMEALARETQMQGDAVSLPGYYVSLHYAALLLGVLGVALAWVLTLYPTLYNWCAVQSEKEVV